MNEYAFHFVRHLAKKPEVAHLTLFVDDLPSSESSNTAVPKTNDKLAKGYSAAVLDKAEAVSRSTLDQPQPGLTKRRAGVSFVPCWIFNRLDNLLRITKAVRKVKPDIEAFTLLQKEREEPLELVIAGMDSPNASGYLKGIAETYRHVKNIRFIGYEEEEDVSQIFVEAAIVVFPYTSTTGSSGVLHQAGD